MPSHLEGKIQAGKPGIGVLEGLNDPQGEHVVFEALSEWPHHRIELGFSGMPEGRMADIVRQRQRFGQILVQAQHRGHRAGDLRDFDGMRETVAEMVGKAGGEDLGFILKPSKCPRVDYPVAVTPKFIAIGMRRLRIAPAQ